MTNTNERRIAKLPLGAIYENPLNLRSMDEGTIRILSDSIANDGLMQPLVVYKKEDGIYTLLLGHRRLRALKMLDKSDDYELPCIIVPKPADEFEEQEWLTKGNIHRSLPDEIENEVKRADQVWSTMDPDKKQKYYTRFKDAFKLRNSKNPKYVDDPDGFTSNNFRARFDYIRLMTGLDYTDKTIKKIINGVVPKEEKLKSDDEQQLTLKKETTNVVKKETSSKSDEHDKDVSGKDILKELKSIVGMLQLHQPENEVEAYKCECVRQECEYLIDYYNENL